MPSETSVAEAWEKFMAGDTAAASNLLSAATVTTQLLARCERQRLQIVRLAFAGGWDRAGGLASEHLAEFPGDELIGAVRDECDNRGR